MTHLRKLTKPSPLKWVSRFPSEEHLGLLKTPILSSTTALCCRNFSSFHTRRLLYTEEPFSIKWVSRILSCNQLQSSKLSCFHSGNRLSLQKLSFLSGIRGFCTEETATDSDPVEKILPGVAEAQAALLDYLHSTRSLQFPDAEHMSKNSPIFLYKLLNKVENEEQIGRAITRFLRYHPINEFEPFFESLGLKPCEFDSLLPRDLMFLSDDDMLLENYYVLCNYGIARGKIGKIYKEATDTFRYNFGVLGSKLLAYEGLGLSKSSIIKIVASCPSLLIGDVNREFVMVLEKLEDIGIQRDWIGGILSDENSYSWGKMLVVFQFFSEVGFTKQEIGTLIRRHPGFLLDGSGKMMFSLVGLLLKLGGTKMEILSLFSQFPCVQVGSFMRNLRHGLLFLIEIEMDSEDIQKLVRTHTEVLGLCSLKKANSILTYLNIGRKRLCRIIKEDPFQLQKYALGMRVERLPNSGEDKRSLIQKTEFLLGLGFVEDSKEMKKALKLFRGKGDELQDRYDCLVKAGLDPNDVSDMIKLAPHILNQKRDVLECKIDFLVNGLGYPLRSLVVFPAYLSYTIERVKLRLLMYDWLKDNGKARPALALSSILACSDKIFRKRFICHHPKGPELWEKFKKALSTN